jgi:riboflavin synthase
MFSGIVEETATITRLEKEQENLHITLTCTFVDELSVDQSISHDGVCLTVVKKTDNDYTVTAILETLQKTNLRCWEVGTRVNLERSVMADGRLDGHMVQGHIDLTAICTEVKEAEGSWYYTFQYKPQTEEHITVEKGSVSVNGVSLTVVNSREKSFQVAIIPYTHQVTNFHEIRPGTTVNIEFDIIGKYIARILKKQLGNKF